LLFSGLHCSGPLWLIQIYYRKDHTVAFHGICGTIIVSPVLFVVPLMMTLREDVVKEQIHGGERLASLGFADAIDAGRSKTAMCGVTRSIAQLPSTRPFFPGCMYHSR